MTNTRKALLLACLLPAFVVAWGGILSYHTIVGVPDQDVTEYWQKSMLVLGGHVPYRDFVLEYPILSLIPMLLPHLLTLGHATSFPAYAAAFLTENILLAAALGATLAAIAIRLKSQLHNRTAIPTTVAPATEVTAQRAQSRPASTPGAGTQLPLKLGDIDAGAVISTVAKNYAIMLACTAVVAPWRFDLFVALLTALAILALARQRDGASGALLAAGVLAKLYPAVLLPAFVRVSNRRATFWVIFAIPAAAIALAAAGIAGPKQSISFLSYHALRGIQIESVAAGVVYLLHAMHVTSLGLVYNFGAYHLAFPAASMVIKLLTVALAVLFSIAVVVIARSRQVDAVDFLPRSGALLLLAFIVASKVFSVQYTIWLIPFAVFFKDKSLEKRCLMTLFALTAAEMIAYAGLIHFDVASILILNARNVAAVVCYVVLATSLRRPLA